MKFNYTIHLRIGIFLLDLEVIGSNVTFLFITVHAEGEPAMACFKVIHLYLNIYAENMLQ